MLYRWCYICFIRLVDLANTVFLHFIAVQFVKVACYLCETLMEMCLFTGVGLKKIAKVENDETRNCECCELPIDVPEEP